MRERWRKDAEMRRASDHAKTSRWLRFEHQQIVDFKDPAKDPSLNVHPHCRQSSKTDEKQLDFIRMLLVLLTFVISQSHKLEDVQHDNDLKQRTERHSDPESSYRRNYCLTPEAQVEMNSNHIQFIHMSWKHASTGGSRAVM